ncbi:MAG: succinate dehydrogenase cytochrome b subunit [Deltaproteobacteria bacterium]|nr:succinate dehydrogenase cytochrome b subunit [Deltaproteobacteria bacterium]MBI3293412.1 succinate dehydrogenase cytochrome b subunit [Deltaproteobacteria bacterium]
MESISRCRQFCRSTVGSKFIVGITGVLLSGFVLLHLLENTLILVGAETYNKYTHMLGQNLLVLYTLETILASIFLVHITTAVKLYFDGRKARPVAPRPASGEKAATFAARSMILTGLLVLVFLVWHLKSFRFGPHYDATYDGVVMRDLHKLVLEELSEGEELAIYLVAFAVLWAHLSHGVSAVFQSLGLMSSRAKRLRALALGFSTVVCLGYSGVLLWVYMRGGQ